MFGGRWEVPQLGALLSAVFLFGRVSNVCTGVIFGRVGGRVGGVVFFLVWSYFLFISRNVFCWGQLLSSQALRFPPSEVQTTINCAQVLGGGPRFLARLWKKGPRLLSSPSFSAGRRSSATGVPLKGDSGSRTPTPRSTKMGPLVPFRDPSVRFHDIGARRCRGQTLPLFIRWHMALRELLSIDVDPARCMQQRALGLQKAGV